MHKSTLWYKTSTIGIEQEIDWFGIGGGYDDDWQVDILQQLCTKYAHKKGLEALKQKVSF